ncbi:MAG: NADH-quinone oxidoreductase subunit M [Gammaproteobacteria bacterium]|jgi:NADH-quinone oxidoreductase subunit M
MHTAELHWTAQAGYPVLTVLQLLPATAAGLVLALRDTRAAYPLALCAALVELLLSLDLYRLFDPARPVMQLAEHLPVSPMFHYNAAVDGMSVLFIVLTSVISLLVILYSWVRALPDPAPLLATLFGIQAALQGMFVTLDLLWFAILSTIELLLIAYLLQRWARAPQDAMVVGRFLQFMGIGLLLLFAGTFLLGWNHAGASGGQWSFNLHDLSTTPVPVALQSAIFFLLFYGLGVRIPLFPLHGWLPLVAEHGTLAKAGILLLGLKTGIYAIVRFVLPLLPDAVVRWNQWLATIALIGVFYAATLAFRQTNLRRMLAFAVISHSGLIVIGLFSLSRDAFEGGILLSMTFGMATAGLLLMSGFVYRRTRTLLLPRLGGLFGRLPVIGIGFLIAALSIVGMPGTPGFDAVHLMLVAAILEFGAMFTVAAALGNVAAAAFLLWAFQRTFLAPRAEHLPPLDIEPATAMERFIAVTLIALLLGAGFHTGPWLTMLAHAFDGLTALYGGAHQPELHSMVTGQ